MTAPILFVLPVSGGSGGAHSVIQEADAMRRMGIDVKIAVNYDNASKLRKNYREFSTLQNSFHSYANLNELAELIKKSDPSVVVATTNQSVHAIDTALKMEKITDQRTAYYIQDYEPLFYEKGSDHWNIAYASYGLIPGMIHFAKTRWLQEVVEENHNVQVSKVEPSIDHDVYYPDFSDIRGSSDKIRIAVMVRPSTPRRAPRRTNRIIDRIALEFSDATECTTFGCTNDELRFHSLRIDKGRHLGVLTRADVGDLFRHTDLFLDLSDFQAFGRTAIEAMSCGASAVVPAHGGTYEYAIDGVNSFIVDTRSDDAILGAIAQFISMSVDERNRMKFNAIRAGFNYNPQSAALSEISVLLP